MSGWQINVLKVTGLQNLVQTWVAIRFFLAKRYPTLIKSIPSDNPWGCRSPFGRLSQPSKDTELRVCYQWDEKYATCSLCSQGPSGGITLLKGTDAFPHGGMQPQTEPNEVTTAGEGWWGCPKGHRGPQPRGEWRCGRFNDKLVLIYWNRGSFRMARSKASSSTGSELFVLCIRPIPAWLAVPVECLSSECPEDAPEAPLCLW